MSFGVGLCLKLLHGFYEGWRVGARSNCSSTLSIFVSYVVPCSSSFFFFFFLGSHRLYPFSGGIARDKEGRMSKSNLLFSTLTGLQRWATVPFFRLSRDVIVIVCVCVNLGGGITSNSRPKTRVEDTKKIFFSFRVFLKTFLMFFSCRFLVRKIFMLSFFLSLSKWISS